MLKLITKQKTLHQSKSVDMDKVFIEWVGQHQREKFPLNHSIIIA